MKILKLALFILPIWLSPVSVVRPQEPASPELQRLAERIERSIERDHPDWRLERIAPITSSENILIDQWRFGDNSIRMSLVAHRSHVEATEAIQRFARDMRAAEEVRDLAEGGYWFGIDRAELTFIKGKITAYLTSATEIGLDPYVTHTKDSNSRTSDKRTIATDLARHAAQEIDSQE